jgi:flagellar hook-basal body complex protein FliE
MIDSSHTIAMRSILDQIRQFEQKAQVKLDGPGSVGIRSPLQVPVPEAPSTGFGSLLKNAVDSVNAVQTNAKKLSDAYERGGDVPLTDVVLAMQRSSVAFEATLQVRNQVMKAYEDIRNMPI